MFPLINIGLLRDMTIVPVIYPPAQQAEFEAYAYRIFSTDPGYIIIILFFLILFFIYFLWHNYNCY